MLLEVEVVKMGFRTVAIARGAEKQNFAMPLSPRPRVTGNRGTVNFAVLQRIQPMVETLPLEHVNGGYQRTMANQEPYRVVLTTTE